MKQRNIIKQVKIIILLLIPLSSIPVYFLWFKKKGAKFNARCKKNVFTFPCGRSKLHPTEKNHKLLEELILDNSNEGDIIFDPCSGSGSHLYVAKNNNRRYLGCELQKEWFDKSVERLSGQNVEN